MRLTERHIECAHLCAPGLRSRARNESYVPKWGVTRATIFGSLIVHLDSSFGRKSPCPGRIPR